MSQEQDKAKILEAVKEYCEKYHMSKPDYVEGDRISYAARVYDSEEMTNLIDASRSYEANATALNASKTIAMKGLEMSQ